MQKEDKYQQFTLEIILLVRELGRGNLISKGDVEELKVKYNIKLGDLKDVKID